MGLVPTEYHYGIWFRGAEWGRTSCAQVRSFWVPSALLRLPASDNGLRVSGDGAAARRDVQRVRGGEKRRETARNGEKRTVGLVVHTEGLDLEPSRRRDCLI